MTKLNYFNKDLKSKEFLLNFKCLLNIKKSMV